MKKNRFFLLLAAIMVTAAFASCNMGSSDVTPTALSIEMFTNAFKVGKKYTPNDYEVKAKVGEKSYQIVTDKARITVNGTTVASDNVVFSEGENTLSASYGGKTATKTLKAYNRGDVINASNNLETLDFFVGTTLQRDFVPSSVEYFDKDWNSRYTTFLPDSTKVYVYNTSQEEPSLVNLGTYTIQTNDAALLYYIYENETVGSDTITSVPDMYLLNVYDPTTSPKRRLGPISPRYAGQEFRPTRLAMLFYNAEEKRLGTVMAIDADGVKQENFTITLDDGAGTVTPIDNTGARPILETGKNYTLTVTYTYNGTPVQATKTFIAR
ncbi:MAG: hypothetical protein SPD11_06285 [Sphaerochaetaceae bacterium]|nr:hypothetical protein [Sphaerochaetaceae bacterium]